MMLNNEVNEKFEREMVESYKTAITKFFKDKTKIHFKLKNGIWGNGFIIRLSDDFFIVDDDRVGEQTIFFTQVRNLNINVDKNKEVWARRGREGIKRGILSHSEHKEIGVTLKILKTKLLEEIQTTGMKATIKVVSALQISLQKVLEQDYGELEGVETKNIYLEGGD